VRLLSYLAAVAASNGTARKFSRSPSPSAGVERRGEALFRRARQTRREQESCNVTDPRIASARRLRGSSDGAGLRRDTWKTICSSHIIARLLQSRYKGVQIAPCRASPVS
jgi:hypothetical protein